MDRSDNFGGANREIAECRHCGIAYTRDVQGRHGLCMGCLVEAVTDTLGVLLAAWSSSVLDARDDDGIPLGVLVETQQHTAFMPSGVWRLVARTFGDIADLAHALRRECVIRDGVVLAVRR